MGIMGYQRVAAATLVVAIGIGSCKLEPEVLTGPSQAEPASQAERAAPVPDSPASALRLLEWSYERRQISSYALLLADDFLFTCSSADPAGGTPWTRTDELAFAQRLFTGGGPDQSRPRSIRLTTDRNLVVSPDPSSPWDPAGRWRARIRTPLSLVLQTEEGRLEIVGHANFSLVRGDSALIPPDLVQRGYGPDSTRWHLRAWDDETAAWPKAASTARRAGTLGGTPITYSWCELKTLYR